MTTKKKAPEKGYIIVGYVWPTRGSQPRMSYWSGHRWTTSTARLYRTRRLAEKETDRIDDRHLDSMEIQAMPGCIAF